MLDRWHNDPEYRALISEMARERWRDNPEYRARITEAMRELWRNNPEFRALISKATRERWRKPEFRIQMIEVLKAARRKQLAGADSSNDRD